MGERMEEDREEVRKGRGGRGGGEGPEWQGLVPAEQAGIIRAGK